MADTVLSMARSMLHSAVSKAASAAAEEMSLLIGVEKDIWFIKDELMTMQAFLVAAEAMKKKDLLLKVWAKQVRDLSYKIEDCLDEFVLHVRSRSLSRQLMKLKDRHRIAVQIRNLKSRVEEVSNRNTRYNLIDTNISITTEERDSFMEDIRNLSPCNIDEAELVGFSIPKQELINLIDAHAMDGPARVVCVVGMGGLGKTTITRKVYEDIAKKSSCCAWIIVSQSFVRMDLLKVMIKEFFGDEALKKKLEGKVVREDDLATYLREQLDEKRYFVVLDDLWNIDDWKWINSIAFPTNSNKGSRIIVTTRDVGLARQCIFESSEPLIYYLKPLQIDDATNLLLRKTMKRQEDMANDDNLKNIVTKLVKKCGCLPLAILTIGAILATKKTTEWGSFYTELPSELENNPSLEATRRMVTLSYSHLPSHLKPCFLYLSIFPEDSEIQRSRLVDRWIAEGFVRARGGVNVKDVGKSYFNELINRSMIQPSAVNMEGRAKSCRVHDIMRDIMVSISREENFVYLAGDSVTSAAEENFHHVAHHGGTSPKIGMDWGHVRSLTVFGERPTKPAPSLCSSQLRMLRALDLQDARFTVTQEDINGIGLLRHLKYLCIQASFPNSNYVYALPRSIGKLQGLQTLDLGDSHITTLPTEISRLHSLRSIRCTGKGYYWYGLEDPRQCWKTVLCLPKLMLSPKERPRLIAELHMAYSSRLSRTFGVRVPSGMGNLKELEILEAVDIKLTSSKAIEELGALAKLRKLGLTTSGRASVQKCKILCAAIEKLSSLRSLDVTDYGNGGTLEWLDSISSPPPLLRTLKLFGYLGVIPKFIRNHTPLVKIILWGSKLNEAMGTLGALPNLMFLDLGRDAYVGEKLVLGAGAFPNLRILQIYGWEQLRGVKFEEGASPQMERISIYDCRLESGIVGIKHLPRLKEISLGYEARVGKLGVLQGEVDAHPNHPVLRLLCEDRSEHDLGIGDVLRGEVKEDVLRLVPEDPSQHDLGVGDVEGSDVEVEATAEQIAGESSQVQVQVQVLMPTTTNGSEDDLLYTYNSC